MTMAFQLSPGINTSEIDLTTVVPAVSSTTGAIAGVFAWGPVNEPILVSSEVDLVNRFGKPVTGLNIETFFTAADFLAYGNALYVARANTGVTAAPSAGSTAALVGFSAKYQGTLGNSLKIIMATNTTFSSANSILTSVVSSGPVSGEAHAVIVDTTGAFSGGVVNAVLEVFEDISLTAGAKKVDGTNNYFADVINTKSNYVKITAANTAPLSSAIDSSCVNGTNGDNENTVAVGTLQAAYDTFKNSEEIDVSLIMQGPARGTNDVQLANYLVTIAEDRKDAMVFISPARSDVVDASNKVSNVTSFAAAVSASSYAVIDSGYKYRYDRYNDTYVYTPLNGDIAGLCAKTDDVRDPWFSPAGYNRGGIKNVIKLAYNPVKADRDALYKAAVNPVISQPGQGTILFGDKTHLVKPSAFDRINVRRLFIVLEKAITRASTSALFEFNDEFTRAQFRNIIEPFLRDVQGRRGIYDFRVVCDATNNTSTVIDRNEFVGDIYIKPARAINFIQLNFVAVRSGVEFEEIVGQR
jgi:phage tail sheath protein FI